MSTLDTADFHVGTTHHSRRVLPFRAGPCANHAARSSFLSSGSPRRCSYCCSRMRTILNTIAHGSRLLLSLLSQNQSCCAETLKSERPGRANPHTVVLCVVFTFRTSLWPDLASVGKTTPILLTMLDPASFHFSDGEYHQHTLRFGMQRDMATLLPP